MVLQLTLFLGIVVTSTGASSNDNNTFDNLFYAYRSKNNRDIYIRSTIVNELHLLIGSQKYS